MLGVSLLKNKGPHFQTYPKFWGIKSLTPKNKVFVKLISKNMKKAMTPHRKGNSPFSALCERDQKASLQLSALRLQIGVLRLFDDVISKKTNKQWAVFKT